MPHEAHGADGDGTYRCRRRKYLRDKGKEGGTHIARTTVSGDQITRDPDVGHDVLCEPLIQEAGVAQQMPRGMDNGIREGQRHMDVFKRKSASLGNHCMLNYHICKVYVCGVDLERSLCIVVSTVYEY